MSILKEFVKEILFDALNHSIKKVEINKEYCNFYYQYRYDTELFLTFYIHAELIIIQDLEQSFSIKEFIDLDLDRSPCAGLQNKEFISFLQDRLDVFVNRKHVDYFSDDSIIKEILVLEEKNERLEKELEKFMNKKEVNNIDITSICSRKYI